MVIFRAIKKLVVRRKVIFTRKAEKEMEADNLEKEDVYEAILNAPAISKRLRSKDPNTGRREYLHVIIGPTFDGMVIYTKGKMAHLDNQEVFYVLISSKKALS